MHLSCRTAVLVVLHFRICRRAFIASHYTLLVNDHITHLQYTYTNAIQHVFIVCSHGKPCGGFPVHTFVFPRSHVAVAKISIPTRHHNTSTCEHEFMGHPINDELMNYQSESESTLQSQQCTTASTSTQVHRCCVRFTAAGNASWRVLVRPS